MKLVYLILLLLFTFIFSCKKDNDGLDNKKANLYELPWKTEYIHYENVSMCRGNHSYGYKLYYKDSLLKEECVEFGSIQIIDSLLVNDSIIHLFFSGSNSSYVLTTVNGGNTFDKISTGPPSFQKFHFVNSKLTYCVTYNQNDLYFTGIGKSSLSVYKDKMTKGSHYIFDYGTSILNIDSTLIAINDSVQYIIKLKK